MEDVIATGEETMMDSSPVEVVVVGAEITRGREVRKEVKKEIVTGAERGASPGIVVQREEIEEEEEEEEVRCTWEEWKENQLYQVRIIASIRKKSDAVCIGSANCIYLRGEFFLCYVTCAQN